MSAEMHEFKDGAALAEGLADKVSAALSDAIAARGRATIAVSGSPSLPEPIASRLLPQDVAPLVPVA